MFEIKIVINVLLGSPDGKSAVNNYQAYSHITLRQDATHRRWHVHGKHDHRFPGTGPIWLNYKRSTQHPNSIILLNKHGHEWAELRDFPETPNIQSKGFVETYNLHYPVCQYYKGGRWLGSWWVDQHATQTNMPLIDPNDGFISRSIKTCTRDTGWRFITSSGGGVTGGAGAGAGAMHANLIIGRKETADTRRWKLTINGAGVGLMTPGVSMSGSTQSTPSTGLTNVLAGPDGKIPFPIQDFAGTVLFFDVGAGAGISKASVGGSTTTFMFIGGVYNDGLFPDCNSMKAILQVLGGAGGGGNSTTKFSAGASGLCYAGVCTVSKVA
ncbi:MAG: hypothetical protein ABIZ64_16380 [Casimicrobium sp.]|jgi:hypothetical protein